MRDPAGHDAVGPEHAHAEVGDVHGAAHAPAAAGALAEHLGHHGAQVRALGDAVPVAAVGARSCSPSRFEVRAHSGGHGLLAVVLVHAARHGRGWRTGGRASPRTCGSAPWCGTDAGRWLRSITVLSPGRFAMPPQAHGAGIQPRTGSARASSVKRSAAQALQVRRELDDRDLVVHQELVVGLVGHALDLDPRGVGADQVDPLLEHQPAEGLVARCTAGRGSARVR